MDAPEERIQFLLTKYRFDRLSTAEMEELNAYILQETNEDTINKYLDNSLMDLKEDDELAIDANKIYQNILSHPLFLQELIKRRKYKQQIRYYAKIAAVFVLVTLSIGAYFYLNKSTVTSPLVVQQVEGKINPGGNKAILSTSKGLEVPLSEGHHEVMVKEGEMTYADGSRVIATSSSQDRQIRDNYYQLKTPRGGQYQVKLEDGTQVYLNAASSLKYPTRFGEESRTVELTGEAYFEIAADRDRPFYVISQNQKITVLGTKFNVSAYEDEPLITTTLMEGAVRVGSLINNKSQQLKPGQQSIYSLSDGRLSVQPANMRTVSAWYRGYFDFTDQNIRSVMPQIARWYDVEVVFQSAVSDQLLEGDVSRFDKVEDVLAVLSAIGAADFQVKGRKIIVNKAKQ